MYKGKTGSEILRARIEVLTEKLRLAQTDYVASLITAETRIEIEEVALNVSKQNMYDAAEQFDLNKKKAETLQREAFDMAGRAQELLKIAESLLRDSVSAKEQANEVFVQQYDRLLAAKRNKEHIEAQGMSTRDNHLHRVIQVQIAKLERRIAEKEARGETWRTGIVSVFPEQRKTKEAIEVEAEAEE